MLEYIPTEEDKNKVIELAQVGIPPESIALVLDVSTDTIRRHFPEELAVSRIKLNSRIANCLAQKALQGDTTAQIFYLKTQMGWRESNPFEGMNVSYVIQIPEKSYNAVEWQQKYQNQKQIDMPSDMPDSTSKKPK